MSKDQFDQFFLNETFLNILVSLLPVFIIPHLREEEREASLWHLFWCMALPVAICLRFPLHVTHGIQIDLHNVQPMMGALLFGWRLGLPLAGMGILYLLITGNAAAPVALAGAIVMLTLIELVRKRFGAAGAFGQYALLGGMVVVHVLMVVLSSRFFSIVPNSSQVVQLLVLSLTTNWAFLFLWNRARSRTALLQQLETADRLRLVSQLAASLSHEIRNPLTVIGGFVQLLIRQEWDRPKQRMYFALIQEELNQAQTVLHNYLSLARTERPDICRMYIRDELAYVYSIITPFANMKEVEIQVCVDDSAVLTCDRGKLRQSILHLCKLGVEGMSVGGLLLLESHYWKDKLLVRISSLPKGEKDCVPENLPSARNSGGWKDSDLGGAIVKDMIQSLGGTLQVLSSDRDGRSCLVLLPAPARARS